MREPWRVGLAPELADMSPFALSGAQKRPRSHRRRYRHAADVLVLDEPTAGLDPAGRDEIFELVRSYHKQSVRPSSSCPTRWRISHRLPTVCL